MCSFTIIASFVESEKDNKGFQETAPKNNYKPMFLADVTFISNTLKLQESHHYFSGIRNLSFT
ncbi:hypothetical protein [Adhaeribacter aquaticus]|uniref:hypothetical protein n=1 Tax=Adhaeribacter aquaticus TaxID=299567 RepID=UPI000404C954|nr:hypothetical protein [Adhaeribacter aquaticus]